LTVYYAFKALFIREGALEVLLCEVWCQGRTGPRFWVRFPTLPKGYLIGPKRVSFVSGKEKRKREERKRERVKEESGDIVAFNIF